MRVALAGHQPSAPSRAGPHGQVAGGGAAPLLSAPGAE